MKKLTYILSALIAAMLLTGIVHSLWSTSVVISGTINTGTVEGIWVSADSDDDGIDPGWDKDVGYVKFEGLGTDTLVVIIGNTYPCYNTTITAIYEYTGTVPAIVNKTIVETISWEPASAYGANDGPVWLDISYNVSVGTQLHQGDKIEVVIKVHVEQCAEQDKSYPFMVEMELIQWNEYTPPVPPTEEGTVYLYPDWGYDTTDSDYTLKQDDLNKLKANDDQKYRTKSTWAYNYVYCERLDFTFENMPTNINIVSIDNVTLRFKWTRPRTIDNARIIIYVGSNPYGTHNIILSNLPWKQWFEERTEVIDLKALGVDTVGEINNLWIRFQATDGWGAYTWHDLVEVEVTYTYTP